MRKTKKGTSGTRKGSSEELTASHLREALWETLKKVRNGEIHPERANAIAKGSKEILSVVKAEVLAHTLFKASGQDLKDFFGTPKAET